MFTHVPRLSVIGMHLIVRWVNIPILICYAVKANSNLAVLNVLARLGSGFDIVSEGELERVLAAGGDPKKSGVFGRG